MTKKYKPAGKLGSGKRFKAVSGSVASYYESKGKTPAEAAAIGGAIAAKVGRAKYKGKMTTMAIKGKKRAAKGG